MALVPYLAKIRRNLPRAARLEGFQARVTSGYRSRAAQTKLYNRYLQGLQPYPVAPPGTSDHEKGLALDVVSTNTGKLVSLLTSVGLSWAGPDDPVHFSLKSSPSASYAEKTQFQIPKTVGQVANIFYAPVPVKIYQMIKNPIQTIKDNAALAFDVLTWMI